MPKVTGLKFAKTNYIYYFKINKKIKLKRGDFCLVKTSIGLDLGKVVIPYKHIENNEIEVPLKNIFRKANKEDMKKWEESIMRIIICLLLAGLYVWPTIGVVTALSLGLGYIIIEGCLSAGDTRYKLCNQSGVVR